MIQIKDNGEKLVELLRACPDLIIDLKYNRKAYVREIVAEMICRAKSYLPRGMTFIIGDAWRSKDIQKRTWMRRYRRLKRYHPKWSLAKLKEQTDEYVASYEGREVSGHMTGGAVDLRIFKNGQKRSMRSWKFSFEENARSDNPKLSKHLRRNRKIMFSALRKAGLSNYEKEFWHWSYGDLWWAKRNNKKLTKYGPIDRV